ncbi:hypothetical protein Tco_0669514, partial [Tanacetum coccineum]
EMLLCKQVKDGFQLNAEQADWMDDTDDEPCELLHAAYHKEEMLLCKQVKDGFQLNAEQADWMDDT